MDFPRHVHRAGGVFRVVRTADEHAAALADGWSADPVVVVMVKGGERWPISTADAMAQAIREGWTPEAPEPAPAPKKGKR